MTWYKESYRHSLASKGVRTSFAASKTGYLYNLLAGGVKSYADEKAKLQKKYDVKGQRYDHRDVKFLSVPAKYDVDVDREEAVGAVALRRLGEEKYVAEAGRTPFVTYDDMGRPIVRTVGQVVAEDEARKLPFGYNEWGPAAVFQKGLIEDERRAGIRQMREQALLAGTKLKRNGPGSINISGVKFAKSQPVPKEGFEEELGYEDAYSGWFNPKTGEYESFRDVTKKPLSDAERDELLFGGVEILPDSKARKIWADWSMQLGKVKVSSSPSGEVDKKIVEVPKEEVESVKRAYTDEYVEALKKVAEKKSALESLRVGTSKKKDIGEAL